MKVAEWKELRHDALEGKGLREADPVSKTREGSVLCPPLPRDWP